ncbi:MAG: diguanylate cyclase [Acidobacteria bacterium]|nr:diguanylate cyclase [Acidobacteriota bacterium]
MRGPAAATAPQRQRRLIAAALGLVLLAAVGALPAQTPYTRTFSTREGLIQYSASIIVQDERGYLWFGTESGLSRFNGSSFHNFSYRNGFVNAPVISLLAAGPDVYAVSTTGDVFRADFDVMRKLPVQGKVLYLFKDTHEAVWLLATDRIARLDGSKSFPRPALGREVGESEPQSVKFQETLFLSIGENLYIFDGDRGLVPYFRFPTRVMDLLALPDGRLGVVLEHSCEALEPIGTTVTFYKPEEGTRLTCGSTDGESVCLATDRGRLVILREGKVRALSSGLPDNSVMDVLYDYEGNLWAGLDSGGVLLLPRTKFLSFTARDGVGTGDVFFVSVDRGRGGIWAGTRNGGICHIDDAYAVHPWTEARGLPSNKVRGFYMTASNDLLVGTVNGIGIIRPDDTLRRLPFSEGKTFRAFAECPDGSRIAGGADGEIYRLDDSPAGGKLWLKLPIRTLIRKMVWFGGSLFVLTVRGLYIYDGRTLASKPEFEGTEIWDCVESDPRTLWFAAGDKGAWVLRDGAWTRHAPAMMAGGRIFDVDRGPDGRIYCASDIGLFRFDGRAWSRFDTRTGLASEVIYHLGFDVAGRLWVGTDLGLNLLSNDKVLFHFDFRDGLADNECNGNGFLSDLRGNVWFCTMGGISTIDPRRIAMNRHPPRLCLADVEVNGASLRRFFSDRDATPPRPEEFDNDRNSLKFRFDGLSYASGERLRYHYILDGYDTAWTGPTTERVASYPRLPPGSYTFRVRCLNSDGTASGIVSFPFAIRPSIWQRTWVRVLIGCLALGTVFLLFHFRLRAVRRQKERLEELVALRTSELADANRELVQLSITDPLTGLFNRRFFQRKVQEDVALSLRQWRHKMESSGLCPDLGFFMIDIDHFKRLNDNLGHEAGDEVLRQISQRFRETVRISDTLVRWGGEEFLLLSKENTPSQAATLAERLREVVGTAPFVTDGKPVSLTVSIGFCTFPFLAADPLAFGWEAVVQVADQLLYRAKRHGRNRWYGIRSNRPSLTPGQAVLVRENIDQAAQAGLVTLLERDPSERVSEESSSSP